MLKLKKKRIESYRISFARRYRECNRCEKDLNILRNEEIVCALCGETFCNSCINKHQKYCYGTI
ncbi:MAG: hypothetical protein ACFFAO_17175 [Candidatus Hermodarchaeota archaeon]